jgi:hypothetical protein
MKLSVLTTIGALALCAACGPMPHQKAAPVAEAACPDEGPRLPGTGLCQRTAANFIERAAGASEVSYPEGCTSVINETMLPGDAALIYGAAQCAGKTTTLAFAGGAHSASITYETDAVGGDAAKGQEVFRLFGVDPDPQGALKGAIAELPAAEQAKCEIRAAGVEGWPADAVVIAPTAAARATLPKDEPLKACGPLGLDEDSQTYWRVRQGQAWFFTLGQENAGFDPASLTIIEKGPDGAWAARK